MASDYFRSATRLLFVVILLAVGVATIAILGSRSDGAQGGVCGKSAFYASPTGDDGGDGSRGDPFRSIEQLVKRTPADGVACLRAGTYEIASSTLAIAKPLTLMSYPGITAREPGIPAGSEAVEVDGRLAVNPGAEGTTIEGLALVGNASTATTPAVFASHTTLRGNDITNEDSSSICVVVNHYGNEEESAPAAVTIKNNKIHDCGIPTSVDSGDAQFDQAVYIADGRRTKIAGNWIYDNTARGIQLYPNARRSVVVRNVIDGNGEGVLFGGDGETASSGNLVKGNVISNSNVRWNIESHWTGGDDGLIGSGNIAVDNCVYPSNSTDGADYYNSNGGIDAENHPGHVTAGYSVSETRVGDPGFVDRDANDYSLAAGSPCTQRKLLGAQPWSGVKCVASDYPPSSRFTGMSAPDVLAGTDGPDYLEGGGERDTMDAGGGGDCLRGAAGLDSLFGGVGSDRIFGGADEDSIVAADGEADEVICGDGVADRALVDVQDSIKGCQVTSYP